VICRFWEAQILSEGWHRCVFELVLNAIAKPIGVESAPFGRREVGVVGQSSADERGRNDGACRRRFGSTIHAECKQSTPCQRLRETALHQVLHAQVVQRTAAYAVAGRANARAPRQRPTLAAYPTSRSRGRRAPSARPAPALVDPHRCAAGPPRPDAPRPPAARSGPLSAGVPQPRRHPVDRQVNPPLHPLLHRAAFLLRAVAPHQLDLQVVQRVEVRESVRDRARQ
jgi:hypothetical protein